MYRLLPEQKIGQADDLMAKANEIANECKIAEIDCAISRIERDGSVIVTISLPEKPNSQTVDFLRRYQIVPSNSNVPIKLEIRPQIPTQTPLPSPHPAS